MTAVALGLLALVIGGLVLELYAAARAPLGYQDEQGFHLGTQPPETAKDRESENPS